MGEEGRTWGGREGQQHSVNRPRGWMAWRGCASVQIECFWLCVGLSVKTKHNCGFQTATGSKEVSMYQFDSGILINSPRIHQLFPSLPPPPPPPTLLLPKTANLASVRAWRTLSAVSTAELVVAPSAEELSLLVSVAAVTQSSCLLLD